MQKQSTLFLFTGLLILLITGCVKPDPVKPDLKTNLQKIVDQHLAVYKNRFAGKTIGFGLYVKSQGQGHLQSNFHNEYVSSGFPAAMEKTYNSEGPAAPSRLPQQPY